MVPVKRHRGEPGHTRDTRDTRTHKGTRTTHRRTSQPSKPTNNTHPARQRDDRSHGRLKSQNSRRPGADRTPRPTQKRPPPANPTLLWLPVPVKRHRGEPGQNRGARTHKGTRTTQTNLTTIQTHQQHTPRKSPVKSMTPRGARYRYEYRSIFAIVGLGTRGPRGPSSLDRDDLLQL